nr:sigma-70 family RNA polymerase sigma factor [Microthrixaceae bacterium]
MGTPRGRPSQHQQTRTIEELASAARGGDTAAFHDLYVQLSPSLTRLAARILRDDAEAVAAADDALLSGVQRWNGGTNFTSWIYRRTQWTAITALRRRARAPEPTDDEIIDLRAADDVESEVLLRSVIESLDA